MTQNQGFGKICDFPIVIAEQPLSHQHNSNVNEYNGSATLYKTTKDILEFAIALAQEKQIRSKKDYSGFQLGAIQ